MIEQIRQHYNKERCSKLDIDFLNFEEEMSSSEDLARVAELLSLKLPTQIKLPNPHNSCILYACELTDEFDFVQARANTIGGSPPDIDTDFDALERQKAIDWVVNHWGADRVCSIATFGTFKPKSVTKDWFRVTEGSPELMREILSKIPPPQSGFEPTLTEIIKGNPDKGYQAHKELTEEARYALWLDAATKLEGMVNKFGIHAAGIVISDFPITDVVPTWTKKDKTLLPDGSKPEISKVSSQEDMKEVEELGLIKFDFLGIDNLSVLKECHRLVRENHNIDIDVWNIPDNDKRAYELLNSGYMTGIFQMETSGTARQLISAIKPTSIEELSDISALNRPGPMKAGLDQMYIQNKNAGYDTRGIPRALEPILKKTHYTLVYQEQIMRICSDLGGYTLLEADNMRRIIGKKKPAEMAKAEPEFIARLQAHSGMQIDEIKTLWKEIVGFAEYGFNKSHSVAYSIITYICAWFKANYPAEFFCALMSVRSNTLQPKDWAAKAPQYVREAESLNVKILPPSVNSSDIGFHTEDGNVFFGLNAIRSVGKVAGRSIVYSRNKKKFTSIQDFIERVNLSKVNTKTFESLVHAGAFDRMGYIRKELLAECSNIYSYTRDLADFYLREAEIPVRDEENHRKDVLKEKKLELEKEIKKLQKLIESPKTDDVKRTTYRWQLDPLLYELQEYEEMDLKKKPALKPKQKPEFPVLTRSKSIQLDLLEVIMQAEYIGCYIGTHPAEIIYPQSIRIAELEEDIGAHIAGVVTELKQITTKTGKPMAFLSVADATGVAEIVLFSEKWLRMKEELGQLEIGDIVYVHGMVEAVDPIVKMKTWSIDKYTINRTTQ